MKSSWERGILPDTTFRFDRYFKMSLPYRLGLQMDYELDVGKDTLEVRFGKEVTPMAATGGFGERLFLFPYLGFRQKTSFPQM
jgi:hypothetical protein